jgi:drug/metabolite transporter, DME family
VEQSFASATVMHRTSILLAAVCFGTTGTAQALGPAASPLAVGSARIAVGAALLAVAAAVLAPRAAGPWRWRMLALAALGIAAYQLTFFAAVDQTGVALGTVVALGSAPVGAGLLGRLLVGEPLTARWAACTALAAVGVALLVLGGEAADVRPGGIALALGAGAAYALYTVAAKRMLMSGDAPETVMARSFGLAAVALAPVLALSDPGALAGVDGLALALYLGAVPTALAYVLFARGLRGVASGEAATLTLAEPVTAAALGALVLGERPGVVAATGAALVLCSLAALAAPGPRLRPVTA